VFGCALALERNPAVAAAIRESGFDVCSHGWRWIKHCELTEEQERAHIRMAVESMTKTSASGRSAGTAATAQREHPAAARRGGRLPLRLGRLQRRAAVLGARERSPAPGVPYSLTPNDSKFGRGGFFTADDYFTFVKDGFDVLYREGRTQPR
jgi:peptidoglycan/xylan/chitin deacetylase (PgdA/CDA1 family)